MFSKCIHSMLQLKKKILHLLFFVSTNKFICDAYCPQLDGKLYKKKILNVCNVFF